MRRLSFLPYTIIYFLMTLQRYRDPKKVRIGISVNYKR